MAKKFKVIKTDGGTGRQNQCGAAVKTESKAWKLMARMRAQQPPGGSNSFTIEPA